MAQHPRVRPFAEILEEIARLESWIASASAGVRDPHAGSQERIEMYLRRTELEMYLRGTRYVLGEVDEANRPWNRAGPEHVSTDY